MKIQHFFLLNVQYQSLQNSHLGDISPYRSDHSQTKIILTFLFVYFTVVKRGGHVFGFVKYKVHSSFIVFRLSTLIQLSISGLLIVIGKTIRNTCLSAVKREWTSTVC